MFHPGQHVLCVEKTTGWAKTFPGVRFPKPGTVYTVRAVSFGLPVSGGGAEIEGIHLAEIHNPPLPEGPEPSFAAHGFRPVSLSALEVFRHIAPPKREHA